MFGDFFLWCSGADKGILQQCGKETTKFCYIKVTERNKYASIGTTVFLTGLLASISGGYALYSVFKGSDSAIIFSVIFGFIWAFVIFNLDRYIVSSLRKEGNLKKELLFATPRFIIAILISFVIAKPLELKIMESKIIPEISILKDEHDSEIKKNAENLTNKKEYESEKNKADGEKKIAEEQVNNDPTDPEFVDLRDNRLPNAKKNWEAKDKQNTPKINADYRDNNNKKNDPNSYVYGKLKDDIQIKLNDNINDANRLTKEINDKKNIFNDIQKKITEKRIENHNTKLADLKNKAKIAMDKGKSIDSAQITINARIQEDTIKTKSSFSDNFIMQISALGHLTQKDSTMWWTSILLMLLIITIETAPVVVKLLSKRGPYDEILEAIEYETFIEQKLIISEKNDEINNLLQEIKIMNKQKGIVRLTVNKQKLDAELKANENLLNDIANKQAHLAKLYVDKWYEDELAKVTNSTNQQNAKTGQYPPPPPPPKPLTIVGKKWQEEHPRDEIFYVFNNGQIKMNQLIYTKNGIDEFGIWEFITPNEIKMEIGNTIENYTLDNLTHDSVTLKSNNTIIELKKV